MTNGFGLVQNWMRFLMDTHQTVCRRDHNEDVVVASAQFPAEPQRLGEGADHFGGVDASMERKQIRI